MKKSKQASRQTNKNLAILTFHDASENESTSGRNSKVARKISTRRRSLETRPRSSLRTWLATASPCRALLLPGRGLGGVWFQAVLITSHILISIRCALQRLTAHDCPWGDTASVSSGLTSLSLSPRLSQIPSTKWDDTACLSPQDSLTLSAERCKPYSLALIWETPSDIQTRISVKCFLKSQKCHLAHKNRVTV